MLGSGQFGTVYKGSWNQTLKSPVDVAIKALKPDATQMDRIKFLQEAAIMAQFKHPNVVALYGLVNKNTEVHRINDNGTHTCSYTPYMECHKSSTKQHKTMQVLLEMLSGSFLYVGIWHTMHVLKK